MLEKKSIASVVVVAVFKTFEILKFQIKKMSNFQSKRHLRLKKRNKRKYAMRINVCFENGQFPPIL